LPLTLPQPSPSYRLASLQLGTLLQAAAAAVVLHPFRRICPILLLLLSPALKAAKPLIQEVGRLCCSGHRTIP